MNKIVYDFLNYITSIDAPKHNKTEVINDVQKKYHLVKDAKVYYCNYFAIRFSYSKNNSFSNTVLALSKLQKFDMIPFFVVLVKAENDNEVFLANSTFLSKISHSSKLLSTTNIKGSFNGSDIIKDYIGIKNCAKNVDRLYAYHRDITFEDNLERLVFSTNEIQGIGSKFDPNEFEKINIFNSFERASNFIKSDSFNDLKKDLDNRVDASIDAIMVASHIDNTNIRGRLIEYLIASNDKDKIQKAKEIVNLSNELPSYNSKNDLGDYYRLFEDGTTYTDIKTKIVYLDSNPKAYNVDKFLECMAKDNTIFFFYFIGIDKEGLSNKILCSVYNDKLIDSTVVQHHWAGRNSRGVTQFLGKSIVEMLEEETFLNNIDFNKCKLFIDKLLSV